MRYTVFGFLFLAALPLHAQSVTARYDAYLEVWPHSVGNQFQHRMGGTVEAEASVSWARLTLLGGLVRWDNPHAKIESSFLNLEATEAIEFTYGARLTVGPKLVQAGATIYRRGVEHVGRPRVWGIDSTVAGAGYTLGYHDGLRPVLALGPLTAVGPWVWRYNDPLTLPAHDWQVSGAVGRFDAVVAFGGTRDGAVIDVGISQPVGDHLALQVRAGSIELPGWGPDKFRVAAAIRAH